MSGQEKKGNWHPGDPQLAMTMMGGTVIDLTNVEATHVNLILITIMGGVDVIVPHGATIDLDGFILMGATSNKVVAGQGESNMHVRIQSWGAMGGCDIRTPTNKELGLNQKLPKPPRKPGEHTVTFSGGLVMLYKLMAMVVSIAIPIIFLMVPFSDFPEKSCILLGILVSLLSGFLWSGMKFFRILVGAGPEDDDEQSVREYQSASKIGTLIRWLGLVFAFACPVLIILSAFDGQNLIQLGLEKNELMFAGVASAIVSGLIFAVANAVEEFFYGKPK
jgi:hypothetical protein